MIILLFIYRAMGWKYFANTLHCTWNQYKIVFYLYLMYSNKLVYLYFFFTVKIFCFVFMYNVWTLTVFSNLIIYFFFQFIDAFNFLGIEVGSLIQKSKLDLPLIKGQMKNEWSFEKFFCEYGTLIYPTFTNVQLLSYVTVLSNIKCKPLNL